MILPPSISTLFPYTTLFRSDAFPYRFDVSGRYPEAQAIGTELLDVLPGTEEECPRIDFATARPPCIFGATRSEEHTSELQSLRHLVCRLLLEKKKKKTTKKD